MARPTQPTREGTIPCYQCPCIAMCRIKVKEHDGTNMWGRVWNFVFAKECDLIYQFVVGNHDIDISLKDGFDILHCMELVNAPAYQAMTDENILKELQRKDKS